MVYFFVAGHRRTSQEFPQDMLNLTKGSEKGEELIVGLHHWAAASGGSS